MRSLIVPMFNEESRIARCVAELAASGLSGPDTELIFVDDGSTDETARTLEASLVEASLQATTIRLESNRGKGAAVRAGVERASGAFVGFVDADLSTPTHEVERCFALVESGAADVAVATRSRPASVIPDPQPWARRFAGKAFNKLVLLLGLTWMPDTQCGLKVFEASVAQRVFGSLLTERFAFDVEVLARARRCGARVVEVPVEWHHVEVSRVHPIRDGGRMVWDAFRIRWDLWRKR